MRGTQTDARLVPLDAVLLVTGATGFIGSRLVQGLLDRGYRHVRCFVRPSGDLARLDSARRTHGADVEIFTGNLLSREDCAAATQDAAIVFHMAAGRGEKSFPDAVMNSVVTTRNLLEATVRHGVLR